MKKAAVFSCKGLGDGLLALVISHNLFLNGYQTITYHDGGLESLQKWFSHLPIAPYPCLENCLQNMEAYDLFCICYSKSFFASALIREAKKKFPQTTFVINPMLFRKKHFPPYYADTQFDPRITVVKNYQKFCQKILPHKNATTGTGIVPPFNDHEYKKYSRRIIIHPTSGNAEKNWLFNKYLHLAMRIREKGWEPHFVVGPEDYLNFSIKLSSSFPIHSFPTFHELGSFLFQSAGVIGNDSGIGHFASLLQLPTVTVFRNYRLARLWKPGWCLGKTVFVSSWIPNLSPFRMRDKYWKNLLSEKKVFQAFCDIFE